MHADSLTFLEMLAPTLFVVGTLYLLGPMLPIARGWARLAVFASVWVVVIYYLQWRLFETLIPARGTWYEITWLWICFAIELFAIVDQLILYVTFLRISDRRAEADRHEARLRATAPEQLPSVDVFVPTYNEPMEVLEKTIIGALCLDYPNVSVWVLDDGRRPWLKSFCESKGAGYLTRPDNAHAKAGNINHALSRTSGQFVAVFDADFVPQRNFLMRTIGFFADPEIGIVQVPHAFYNHDPMQTNLALRESLPDEQRFFFDDIMPSRDAWNAAFCCGSNSVTRRAALQEVGGGLPTDSITEDMLLTLTLLRKGYVTRYLSEHLAFGLAPESVNAFFVQRERWARGAIQIAYLANGPFGRGLTLMQRLLFVPTHWLSLGLRSMIVVVAPIVFLWTGVAPVFDVTPAQVVFYFIPMVLAMAGGIRIFAPGRHLPLASQVQEMFLSFRILPTVLATVIKPFGHAFKVTPKGGAGGAANYASGIFWASAAMMFLTILGLIVNTVPEWRIVENVDVLPIVAFWSSINIVVLFLVCMLSLQRPVRRGEERFKFDDPIWVVGPRGTMSSGRIRDISLSGVGLVNDGQRAPAAHAGDAVRLFIPEVGFVPGTVVRQVDELLGVRFELEASVERDLLIRKIFTAGLDTTAVKTSTWSATGAMLTSIWTNRTEMPAPIRQDDNVVVAFPVEKLPASSLIVRPQQQGQRLSDLVRQRRSIAA